MISRKQSTKETTGDRGSTTVLKKRHYVIDIAWDRVFYEIYRHEHEGELPCILHKTRGFLMLYVFYVTTTPYLPCNNKNINRKELYDFYYTAITLTTGYKHTYSTCTSLWVHVWVHTDEYMLLDNFIQLFDGSKRSKLVSNQLLLKWLIY